MVHENNANYSITPLPPNQFDDMLITQCVEEKQASYSVMC